MSRFSISLFLLMAPFIHAQHQGQVDFTQAKALIAPDPQNREIRGTVSYRFEVLQTVDSVFLDAKRMAFPSVLLNSREVEHRNDGNRIVIKENFKKGESHRLTLEYVAHPKQTVYFIGWDDVDPDNNQIWTQGQGKYTSHWLPSFDNMNEKVAFDLNISFDKSYTVIANGKLLETVSQEPGTLVWRFDMQKPMSSYLLAFAIGNYRKCNLTSTSGIPIENYYYPRDSSRTEPTYRHTKKIFDFLEAEIGVPYPWQNYKQVPVKDFLYAGMENTGTTIFSDGYVIDSTAFVDKNYVNVNAHELAHQWFGNMVTEVDGNHHWLHEGFATYYAYLAEREIFGADYFHWKLYRSLEQLQAKMDKGEGQSLLDPKASSLVFYEKGALALYALEQQIGRTVFRQGVRSYLTKYRFKNVTVQHFLDEMEQVAGRDLSHYRKEWLTSTKIPIASIKKNLAKGSPSLRQLFEMEKELKDAPIKDIDYLHYWKSTPSIHLKKYMIGHFHKAFSAELVALAFDSDSLAVRQALSQVDSIRSFPKKKFESLLDDTSYLTLENALFQLWVAYPEDRTRYLDKTKGIVGLPNKNVRLLWLTLAVLTRGYDDAGTKRYFDELSGYTHTRYSMEVRQTAFQYLNEAFGLTEQNLLDLVQATDHHSWQFKKFARNLLDQLLRDAVYKERIKGLVPKLNPQEKKYIQGKIN